MPSIDAAELRSFTSKEGRDVVLLSGDITAGDSERLRALITASNQASRMVSGIRLSSGGGQLLEAAKLADTVREARIATVVANGAYCASACFVVFAAGTEKYASYQAKVGVHGASDTTGKAAGDATVAMAKIVKDMGVPPSIIGRMVVTAPDQMVWLSPDELGSMGVKLTGKPSQLAGIATTQSQGGTPMQLQPVASPNSPVEDANSRWKAFIDKASAISARQNNGTPNFTRGCDPKTKTCVTALSFKDEKNAAMIAKIAEDMNGRKIAREICSFNNFGDVRFCVDFDTHATHRDMKDGKGDWYKVSDD